MALETKNSAIVLDAYVNGNLGRNYNIHGYEFLNLISYTANVAI